MCMADLNLMMLKTNIAEVDMGSRWSGRIPIQSPPRLWSASPLAVLVGYAPISIGNETDGSLMSLTGRAALHTIKLTIGLVSGISIVTVAHLFVICPGNGKDTL